MIAPNDHILNCPNWFVEFLRNVTVCPILVQSGEACEVLLGNFGSVPAKYHAIGVGWIGDD